MSSGSGSDSGSSQGEVTADYYGPSQQMSSPRASGAESVGIDTYTGESTYSGGDDNFVGGTDIDATYTTGTEFDVTPTQEPTFGESLTDYITSGGLIGAGIRTVSDIFGTPKNQYAGITGEDVYETPSQYAQDVLNVDYDTLDLESQRSIDQEYYDQGYRSSSFQDLYDTGDVSNLQNLTQPESEEVRRLIPQASYVVGGQQPIESQVNKFFANLGSQSGLSSQLESDYNAAKANVANTLSVTPLAQQFGYSEQPYGALTATNLGMNPFNIPYLQTRGLI